jgi:cytochrome c oxidase cbb3-type subunit 1
MYLLRAFGGSLYLSGALVFAFNIAMTIAGRLRTEKPMTETPYNAAADRPMPARTPALLPAE